MTEQLGMTGMTGITWMTGTPRDDWEWVALQ